MRGRVLRYSESHGSSGVTTNGLSLYNRKNASDREYYIGIYIAASTEQDVRGELLVVLSREKAIIIKPGEDRAQANVGRRKLRERYSIHDRKPRVIEVPAKDNGVSL